MKKKERDALAVKVLQWFCSSARRDLYGRWSRDPVGVVIRAEVGKLGKWRPAPRGNPALGYRRMKEKLGAGDDIMQCHSAYSALSSFLAKWL